MHLKNKIISIIRKNPGYGRPRIKKALKDKYNISVNHKVIEKLLRIWNLQLPKKRTKSKRSWVHCVLDFLQIRANILRQLIQSGKSIDVLDVIVSDITEIPYQCGKAFLCVHMDYASKKILGFCIQRNADVKIVLKSFKGAIKHLRKIINILPKIIFHQDRGSVYTSTDYVNVVQKNKMKISYSRAGEPGDNAVNESFFSRFKCEWLDELSEIKDYKHLCRKVKRIIKYYNQERYHSAIDYNNPSQFLLASVGSLT